MSPFIYLVYQSSLEHGTQKEDVALAPTSHTKHCTSICRLGEAAHTARGARLRGGAPEKPNQAQRPPAWCAVATAAPSSSLLKSFPFTFKWECSTH